MNDDDYIVEIKIKNGPLRRAMNLAGISSVSELARRCGSTPGVVGQVMNLRKRAYYKKGESGKFLPTIKKIAACLNVLPEDLFPKQHLEHPLAKNTAELTLSFNDVKTLIAPQETSPQTLLEYKELKGILGTILDELRPREREVLIRRFGLEGHPGETYQQIGDSMHVTRERIRQLEAKALRRLKHPSKKRLLSDAVDVPDPDWR